MPCEDIHFSLSLYMVDNKYTKEMTYIQPFGGFVVNFVQVIHRLLVESQRKRQ